MITLNLKLTKINILLILVNDSRYRCEVRPTSSSGKVVRHPMTRDELRELGYIAPIATVPSILQHGILSHNRAAKLQHEDISLKHVNDYRATRIIPTPSGGRKLHDYANLYICPRNPMLLKKSDMHEQLCVLRVNANAIDIPGAIVTDANAGSKYTKNFKPAPDGLSIVNYARTCADWWNHPDNKIEGWQHSAQKCAEILVPNVVPATYTIGAYVCSSAAKASLESVAGGLTVTINKHLFFKK